MTTMQTISISDGEEYVVDIDNDRCELRYPLSDVPTEEWANKFVDAFHSQIQFYRNQIAASVSENEVVILCFKLQDRPQIKLQVQTAVRMANGL